MIYDSVDEVTSVNRFLSDGTPVTGQPRQKGLGADVQVSPVWWAKCHYLFDEIALIEEPILNEFTIGSARSSAAGNSGAIGLRGLAHAEEGSILAGGAGTAQNSANQQRTGCVNHYPIVGES